MGRFFEKLRDGLAKTREAVIGRIGEAIRGRQRIDEGLLEEIEEALIGADVGLRTTDRLINRLRERVALDGIVDRPEKIRHVLKEEVVALFDGISGLTGRQEYDGRPYVSLIVGVNGTGKTTTVGKLAKRYTDQGKRVLVAACDTFRAAAIEQLDVWVKRAGAELVRHQTGADPASVAYDAMSAASARESDVVLIDTAGRLHTKVNLMEELKKIKRVISKQRAGAPDEILLVLDATTGQNAIAQACQFHRDLEISGLVLTKLDGTAKGGIILAIWDQLGIPVTMIGVGEGIDDLQEFNAQDFTEALLG
ncbi:MAG: signal recognition particle-docking protein FtsY [Candidatus Latescibacteria bacterium]|nr:signal recognition particle-docking protein FtsY [Candidatus Latescibacterota bacterium]